jgi:hypothetical protein
MTITTTRGLRALALLGSLAVAAPAVAQYAPPPGQYGPGRARVAPYGYEYGGRAHARGYADGYERGYRDARDRHVRDPWRHRWYRSADRGYGREFGPRLYYQNAYRRAFLDGYELGYRDGWASRRPRGRTGGFLWFGWRF